MAPPLWAIPLALGALNLGRGRQRPPGPPPLPQGQSPLDSPVYKNMLNRYQGAMQGGSLLPAGFRDAVLGRGMRDLDVQKERDLENVRARMNLQGLARSGAAGVREGYIDEAHMRARRDLQDFLVMQELGQFNQLQNKLLSQSRAGSNFALGQQGLQHQHALRQYEADEGRKSALFGNLAQAGMYAALPGFLKKLPPGLLGR